LKDEKDYFVHESSYIDEPVHIGEGTKIWHFCHVMSGARIGQRCNIGQNVFIGRNVAIGNGCKIQNNVSVYEGVTLEDDVFCGPSMVFVNDVTPRSAFPKGSERFVKTLVKRGCSIGANATILCGLTLGEHAFIGAGAVVTKDVPAYALIYGTPARIHGWICECGERLQIQSDQTTCSQCGRAYQRESVNKIHKVKEAAG
jgi:UDP-2-acetamido-3-amino-2,3-dideoxy-glucuronate N-acetyltransferase